MIHDARTFAADSRLRCDVCVVGSGAGGMAAARVLAEAGLAVVVLEPGAFLPATAMTQREELMLPQLYWEAGGRTSVDRATHLHQGKGVGGSTLHNLNLCKRIDRGLLARWASERKLAQLPVAVWDALFDETEALLGVSAVAPARYNDHNKLLLQGAQALGWAAGGLAHNRDGCIGSGFCELGCAYDAKNNAAKVLLPKFVGAGGAIVTYAQAVRVRHAQGRVLGVEAVALAREGQASGRLEIDCDAVVVAASATGTPALLLRSGVPDRSGRSGRGLAIHPAVVAAGDFDDKVRAWEGIPQTVECTAFLRFSPDRPAASAAGDASADTNDPTRIWIVPAFGHPMGTATMMPGFGASHRSVMERYEHLAVFCAMLHDDSDGSVRPDGDLGLAIDYRLSDADANELRAGLRRVVDLLFAAGARRVFLPTPTPTVVARADHRSIDATLRDVDIRRLGATAVHPMATMAMSDDPDLGPVDSGGRHHGLSGLYVADGSLYPTSIGGPPQLGIYALGTHVGRAAARTLGRAGG